MMPLNLQPLNRISVEQMPSTCQLCVKCFLPPSDRRFGKPLHDYALMRHLGLIIPFGGQTGEYYLRAFNGEVEAQMGERNTASLTAVTLGRADHLRVDENWWTLTEKIADLARRLACGGAEAFLLGSLAWYRFADAIEAAAPIPILHPFDALAQAMAPRDLADTAIGVMAPRLASLSARLMERLTAIRHGSIILPPDRDIQLLDEFANKLNRYSRVDEHARRELLRIATDLKSAGADRIVFGYTEFASFVRMDDYGADCYNLPQIQIAAAVNWMLNDDSRIEANRRKTTTLNNSFEAPRDDRCQSVTVLIPVESRSGARP